MTFTSSPFVSEIAPITESDDEIRAFLAAAEPWVPGADFRIGLAAHDLAAALGAPEVVLSYAQRDDGAPVIPSRFVLRIKAMLGELAAKHEEREPVHLARLIDDAAPATAYPRPKPMPSAEQRQVDIAVTGLDRLRSDPYQFYANSILRLRMLDPLDAFPSASLRGLLPPDIAASSAASTSAAEPALLRLHRRFIASPDAFRDLADRAPALQPASASARASDADTSPPTNSRSAGTPQPVPETGVAPAPGPRYLWHGKRTDRTRNEDPRRPRQPRPPLRGQPPQHRLHGR